MNILAVLPMYVPKSRVGAWITTHEYLTGLAARGHQVDVLVLMSNATNQPAYDLDGVHVHPRTWEHTTPDLVVSHLGDRHEGARYAERVGVPSVRMVHGYDPEAAIKLDQTPTALAVFSSRALANETAWPGNQIISHPPVRAEQYRTTPGELVTLSNLSEAKGGEVLRHVATALPDIGFLGVRGGWGRQVDGLPSNVEVVNPVEDMRDVYRRTRVLLMPSERESYGRVAVEAACSGIPTIAHPSPGLREAMGDAARWVDRSHPDEWAAFVAAFAGSEMWLRASERASEHVRHLSAQEDVERVADAVEEVVSIHA